MQYTNKNVRRHIGTVPNEADVESFLIEVSIYDLASDLIPTFFCKWLFNFDIVIFMAKI